MTQPTDSRRRDGWALVLLVGLVSLLLWPYVYGGLAPLPDYLRYFAPWADGVRPETAWNPLWYDAVGQYWPWRSLLAEGLRTNTLPLWSPYQFSGYYLAGNGQSALFYPFNWLFFGLFDVPTGFRLTVLFHLSLAAAGAWFLVRELGGSRAAALTAGLAFPLSGFLTCWLMLPTLISSGAWLSATLAFLERARRTGEIRAGWLAGGCLGLSALAGHPQIFYYVGLAALVLGSVRLLPRRWPAWLACFSLAALLAAPGLLPVLDLARAGHRSTGASAQGYQVFQGRAIPWQRAVTLFLPDYFGSPVEGTVNPAAPEAALREAAEGAYWGLDRQGAISPGDYTEFNVFVGVGVLLLLLVGLWHGPAAARWYGGLALLALLLAGGLGLNRWLYFGLPGWSAGAGPCRLALLWCAGAAVAAGLGLDAARQRSARLPGPAAALLLAGLTVGLATSLWLRRHGLEPLVEVTGYRHLVAACGTAVLVVLLLFALVRQPRAVPFLIALELLLFGLGFNPICEPSLLVPRPPALRQTAAAMAFDSRLLVRDVPSRWGFYRPPEGLLLPPNLATAARLRDVGGYDSLMPAAVKQAMFAALDERQPSPAINGNLLLLGQVPPARLGVDLGGVLTSTDPGPGWLEIANPSYLRLAAGRAPARCLLWPLGGTPRPAPGAIRQDGWNRVTLQVPAVPHLLLDAPDPGWRCYAGPLGSASLARAWWSHRSPFGPPYDRGRFVPLATLDAVASGTLRVQWVFAPVSLRLGLFLAGLGLFALAAGMVATGSNRASR